MAGLTAVQQRQRAAPPFNRSGVRRGTDTGGPAGGGIPRTLAPGLETELTRYPGDQNDTLITRDRFPWLDCDSYIPPPVTWISWTAAGPVRPALHMRQQSERLMVGNSASRFPTANTPTGGMHSAIPSGPAGTPMTAPRYQDMTQMQAVRVDRLTIGQYAGQSYSQTTTMQGRAGRR